MRDDWGNLYGTTMSGGSGSPFQAGVVFKLDPSGKETVLHNFSGGTDGSGPGAGVILDNRGNLYGTTQFGGDLNKCNKAGCGVVFKLSPTDDETVLYTFTGPDGASPASNLIEDSAGNLYGTTEAGGANGSGVVYKLTPTGEETVLYIFTGGTDGGRPAAGLIRDDEGNLYGTTPVGGDLSCSLGPDPGCGVVFKLDQNGKETVLYAFTGGTDGQLPNGSLLLWGGEFYSTTYLGGARGNGVVFKLDPAGKETVLYTFTGGNDGGSPSIGLTRDSAGNLYGTAQDGGDPTFPDCGCGVVFKLQPHPSPTPISSSTPTMTPTPSATSALTPTPTATATIVPGTPHIASVPSTLLVGGNFTITGAGFTNGSVVNLFVATGGTQFKETLKPDSPHGATSMTVLIPDTTPLGTGFASVQVVNTDTGFKTSNAAFALLQGDPAAGIPTIEEINGMPLAATSSDPRYATNNVETVVAQGKAVTLGGTGFQTGHNGVAVDIFCACTGGKVGPIFASPTSSTSFTFTVPTKAMGLNTGPGSFVITNMGADGKYSKKSNAVAASIGARVHVFSVVQSRDYASITVNGTGFSALTVINLFNNQGETVVNFGGLGSDGKPKLTLTLMNDTEFIFATPGLDDGAALPMCRRSIRRSFRSAVPAMIQEAHSSR